MRFLIYTCLLFLTYLVQAQINTIFDYENYPKEDCVKVSKEFYSHIGFGTFYEFRVGAIGFQYEIGFDCIRKELKNNIKHYYPRNVVWTSGVNYTLKIGYSRNWRMFNYHNNQEDRSIFHKKVLAPLVVETGLGFLTDIDANLLGRFGLYYIVKLPFLNRLRLNPYYQFDISTNKWEKDYAVGLKLTYLIGLK